MLLSMVVNGNRDHITHIALSEDIICFRKRDKIVDTDRTRSLPRVIMSLF